MKLDKEQQRGVDLICHAPVGIITGWPGTGKTTILLQALERLESERQSYALCAPTGKAARRMSEATGRPAQTIHRLLGWTFAGFDYYEGNPLDLDVVIVDEASMIDTKLAAALLAAIDPTHTRVIFVGDADQLPPVGPGAPFRDMIDSGKVPAVRLKTLHRSAHGSWVRRNSPRVLAGPTGNVELDDCADFEFHELESDQAWFIPEAISDILLNLKSDGIPEREVQVLTPMRKYDAGSTALNKHLQAQLNPNGPAVVIGKGEWAQTFREGDRVMQTRNDYKLEVFNGEVGYIDSVSNRPPGLRVGFDTGNRVYTQAMARRLELAYAMTIHKSQGSEWPYVIVVCHSTHRFMLSRQLLYTAITRASKAVYLVGDKLGVDTALATVKDMRRRTLLKSRLEVA